MCKSAFFNDGLILGGVLFRFFIGCEITSDNIGRNVDFHRKAKQCSCIGGILLN